MLDHASLKVVRGLVNRSFGNAYCGVAVLEVHDLGDGSIVVVGEVDAHSVALFADILAGQQHDVVRVRLTKCSFMDSSGLRALLVAHADAATRGAQLVVVEPSDVVHRLFTISGVLDHLSIEQSGP